MAIRQRAICCADGISKDWCLTVCGYNQTDDTEYAVCSSKCKISHNHRPIITDTTAGPFSFSTVFRAVSSFVKSSSAFSTLLSTNNKTTSSPINTMLYSLYTNKTTSITLKTTDIIPSSDISPTSEKHPTVDPSISTGTTAGRSDTTDTFSTEFITSSTHLTTDKRKLPDSPLLENSTVLFRTATESVVTNNEYSTEKLTENKSSTTDSASLTEKRTSLNGHSTHNNGTVNTVVTPSVFGDTSEYASATAEALGSHSSVLDSLKTSSWTYFVNSNVLNRQSTKTVSTTEEPLQPRITSDTYTGRVKTTSKSSIIENTVTPGVLMNNTFVLATGHLNKTSRIAFRQLTTVTADHKSSSENIISGTFARTTIPQESSKRPNGSFDTPLSSKASNIMHTTPSAELQSKTGSSKSFSSSVYSSLATLSYPRQSTVGRKDILTTEQLQFNKSNTAELTTPDTTTEQSLPTSTRSLDAKQVVINHKTWTSRNVPSAVIVGATFGSVLALAAFLFFMLFLLTKHRLRRNIIKPTGIEMKEQI